jgi:hypothetical protein
MVLGEGTDPDHAAVRGERDGIGQDINTNVKCIVPAEFDNTLISKIYISDIFTFFSALALVMTCMRRSRSRRTDAEGNPA